MYPDSNRLIKLIFKSYHGLVTFTWMKLHIRFLPAKFTPQDMMIPINKTGRAFYELEERIYRMSRYKLRDGDVLSKREYYTYSLLAKKYGWPYVKETYDES